MAARRARNPQDTLIHNVGILQWATREETRAGSLVKFGETFSGVIPSQASMVTKPLGKV